ncbi:MAG: hypothetical protein HOV94_32800 [Saccharothrix sp.]|nr:hypothetical protein [Saccharothrix sp.]
MLWFARKRQKGRPVALVALGVLLSGFFVAINPGVASAGAIVACPSGITEWKLLAGVYPKGSQAPEGSLDTGASPDVEATPAGAPPWRNLWEGYRYTLVSAVPQFLVSDGRALDNGTDVPVNYSVTSSVSKTYKISATTGVSAQGVKDFLNFNVSTSIEASVTTQIGVNFSTVVPPHTRLIAEYGTDVYQVTYYIEAWRWRGPIAVAAPPPAPGTPGCEEWGYYPQSTLAPTRLETWRLRNG